MTRKNLIRNSEIQQSSQQSSPLPPPTYEAATSKMEHPLPVRQHQAPYSDNPAKDSEKSLHVGLHEVNCQPKKGIFTRRVLAARVKHTFLAVTLLLGGAFLFHTIYAVSPQYRPSVGHYRHPASEPKPSIIPTITDDKDPMPGQSSSRKTILDCVSKAITGHFDLLDLLSLTTTSGSIGVSVSPGSANEDGPDQPAEFVAASSSGSIRATFPSTSRLIPGREYRTHVGTTSGSIDGAYLLSPSTSFRTSSGSIRISLLPAESKDSSNLVTDSVSGRQDVTVHAGDYAGLTKTFSIESTSVNGAIVLRLPGNFEGSIMAETVSGSIRVVGQDVKVKKDVRTGGFRYFEAVKGDGTGVIYVKSVSGSVDVIFG